MEIKLSRKTTVTLTGNRISGDTYPVKDYIKAYLGGTWDKGTRTWIVNLDKVNALIAAKAISVVETTTETAETAKPANAYHTALCPRCHTYCDGDCTSH